MIYSVSLNNGGPSTLSLQANHERLSTTSEKPKRPRPNDFDLEANNDDNGPLECGEGDSNVDTPFNMFHRLGKRHYAAAAWILFALHIIRSIHDFIN